MYSGFLFEHFVILFVSNLNNRREKTVEYCVYYLCAQRKDKTFGDLYYIRL